jgi:hypothetical protein
MFNKVINGGACNSSDQVQGSNAFTNFIDNVIMSKAHQTHQSYQPAVIQPNSMIA